MSQTRILFLVHTEYHLLVAINLISSKFFEEKHLCKIVQFGTSAKRFNLSINAAYIPAAYCAFESALSNSDAIYKVAKGLLNEGVDTFYGFQEQNPLFVYLSYHLKKRGAEIILVQDGGKAYASINKYAIPSRIKMTLNIYRFIFRNKLRYTPVTLVNWSYGTLRTIDQLLVSFPLYFQGLTTKPVLPLEILTTDKQISLSNCVFGFNSENIKFPTTNIVFFLNQPFADPLLIDEESRVLRYFKREKNKLVVIKLHPLTNDYQIARYISTECIIIKDSVPAELYISNLNNCIIISFWSSALFHYTDKNRYYWLHRAIQRNGTMLDWLDVKNPTDYITEVTSLEEII